MANTDLELLKRGSEYLEPKSFISYLKLISFRRVTQINKLIRANGLTCSLDIVVITKLTQFKNIRPFCWEMYSFLKRNSIGILSLKQYYSWVHDFLCKSLELAITNAPEIFIKQYGKKIRFTVTFELDYFKNNIIASVFYSFFRQNSHGVKIVKCDPLGKELALRINIFYLNKQLGQETPLTYSTNLLHEFSHLIDTKLINMAQKSPAGFEAIYQGDKIDFIANIRTEGLAKFSELLLGRNPTYLGVPVWNRALPGAIMAIQKFDLGTQMPAGFVIRMEQYGLTAYTLGEYMCVVIAAKLIHDRESMIDPFSIIEGKVRLASLKNIINPAEIFAMIKQMSVSRFFQTYEKYAKQIGLYEKYGAEVWQDKLIREFSAIMCRQKLIEEEANNYLE